MACGCGGGSNGIWIPQTTMQLQTTTSPSGPQYIWKNHVIEVSGYNWAQFQPELFALYMQDPGTAGTFTKAELVFQFASACTEDSFDNSGLSKEFEIATAEKTAPVVMAAQAFELYNTTAPVSFLGPYMRVGIKTTAGTETIEMLVSMSLRLKLLRNP